MSQGAIAIPSEERPMSLAEWADLPEDEPGELVDGRLVEDEVADAPHEIVVGWLIVFFGMWLHERNGLVLASDAKFAVAPGRGRKPDLSVYLRGDQKFAANGAFQVPPDIIVEVLSPRPRDVRRDRLEKITEYAAFGARWYWIVDPRVRSVEVFGLGSDGRYSVVANGTEGLLAVPGCEGLTLHLDALWRRLDDRIESDTPRDPASDN